MKKTTNTLCHPALSKTAVSTRPSLCRSKKVNMPSDIDIIFSTAILFQFLSALYYVTENTFYYWLALFDSFIWIVFLCHKTLSVMRSSRSRSMRSTLRSSRIAENRSTYNSQIRSCVSQFNPVSK